MPITWVDPQTGVLRQILAELTKIHAELHEQNEMIRRGGDTVVMADDLLDVFKNFDPIIDAMPDLGDDTDTTLG